MAFIMEDTVQDFLGGVYCIDTGYIRSGFAACYLIVEQGQAVFIDTGTRLAVPRLLHALKSINISPDAVQAVIVTHVHLDHAGGAGDLLNTLPNAQLMVHPSGLRHLVDPSKLQAGALMVYGKKQFQESFGGITPSDPKRCVATEDTQILLLNGRPLKIVHTPGHAYHHQCIWDETSGGLFSGDAFGISYRMLDHKDQIVHFPATTPVQFDLKASHQTLDRLHHLKPKWLFLTHFGRLLFDSKQTETLHTLLDECVSLANGAFHVSEKLEWLSESLQQVFIKRLQTMKSPLSEKTQRQWLQMDCRMNAQGLLVMLEKLEKSEKSVKKWDKS